jgi:hypothetical protein
MHNVEQFQKEKDAVKAKQREQQLKMREDLQKQIEEQKVAKQSEKRDDLNYFEYIRSKKDEAVQQEREKADLIKRKIEEQRIIRERQIEEHEREKHRERKQKREEGERLRRVEEEVKEEKVKGKEIEKEKKEKTLQRYQEQIQLKNRQDERDRQNKYVNTGNDMLASIFEQKRNISKELFVQNQKRVDLI